MVNGSYADRLYIFIVNALMECLSAILDSIDLILVSRAFVYLQNYIAPTVCIAYRFFM